MSGGLREQVRTASDRIGASPEPMRTRAERLAGVDG